jgi:hypothetical protein
VSIVTLETKTAQLVLGIKGTLSVVELKVLRNRLLRGQEKARRGELFRIVAPGYIRHEETIVKDPDQRVQTAVELVFTMYGETWSARQTHKGFIDQQVSETSGVRRIPRRRQCRRRSVMSTRASAAGRRAILLVSVGPHAQNTRSATCRGVGGRVDSVFGCYIEQQKIQGPLKQPDPFLWRHGRCSTICLTEVQLK